MLVLALMMLMLMLTLSLRYAVVAGALVAGVLVATIVELTPTTCCSWTAAGHRQSTGHGRQWDARHA